MQYLLAAFFFLIYAGDTFGLAVGIAPGLSLKNLLLYLVLTGIFINTAVVRNRKLELTGVLVMFSLLIAYALVTWIVLTFIARDPDYLAKAAFIKLKSGLGDQLMTLLMFFYGCLALKDTKWLLRAIIWIAVIGNVVTVIDTMNIPDLGILPVPRKGGRFEGFLGQPNEYGQFLALFLPAFIVLFMESRKWQRWLAGLGLFASAIALVLTGSRGAWVGVVGGAVLGCFYMRQYIPAQTVVRAVMGTVVVGSLVLVVTYLTGYADLYLSRFEGIGGTPHTATAGRSSIWRNAIKYMLENPLSFITGYGFYAYESSRNFRLSTHNIYLWYLYNLGVIGLSLFVGVFARVLSTARKALADAPPEQRPHIMGMLFGVLAFLVSSFFSDFHNVGYLLWAYIGIVMRIAMQLKSAVPEQAAAPAGEAPVPRPVPEWRPRGLGSASR
ncbi:MAG TPA: O-antigen ligase family protein [Woeseiaceae bacterium]|nr:O-antigen ligase family protein [Woeseiaceae bacterium]